MYEDNFKRIQEILEPTLKKMRAITEIAQNSIANQMPKINPETLKALGGANELIPIKVPPFRRNRVIVTTVNITTEDVDFINKVADFLDQMDYENWADRLREMIVETEIEDD